MADKKIESLTDQQLIRRKKLALTIIGISLGVFLVCLVLLVIFVSREDKNLAALVPGFILPIMVAPMYGGVKQINQELKKRQGL